MKKREITSAQLPQKMKHIGALDKVAVPTVNSGSGNNAPMIAGFAPTFTLVGGINKPKRIECTGTDGVVRMQLVKAKDDLRQDVVMEQVFEVVERAWILIPQSFPTVTISRAG